MFVRFAQALGLASLILFSNAQAASINDPAPEFTLTDQDGKTVNLADFAGKLVVLEWTNPECPFVVRHYKAKTMVQLAEKYKDKEIVWLAINTTKTADQAFNAAWVKEQALPYPVLNDKDGAIGKLYGAKTTPHMYIVSKEGKLVYQGAIDSDPYGNAESVKNYVDQALTELLDGKAVSEPSTKSYGCSVKYAS